MASDFNFQIADENARMEHNERAYLQAIQQLQDEKKELEQQLAQARAELETALDYAQGLEAWQVTARALLEEIEYEDTGSEKPVVCGFCDADLDYERGVEDEIPVVTHQPDCLVTKIRAFLAAHPTT